jgi:hypothetical protein
MELKKKSELASNQIEPLYTHYLERKRTPRQSNDVMKTQ